MAVYIKCTIYVQRRLISQGAAFEENQLLNLCSFRNHILKVSIVGAQVVEKTCGGTKYTWEVQISRDGKVVNRYSVFVN